MINLDQVAKSSGVSRETASRVLNGKYKGRTNRSRKIMNRVLEQAERLNYRPNNAARALKTRSTGLIGVVIDEGNLKVHPVFSEVMQGVDLVFKEAGYTLTVSSLNGIEEQTLGHRIFEENLIDGLMIFDADQEESVSKMLGSMSNCVLVNTNTWLPTGCIRRDEFHAGQLAGQKLREKGFTKALYFDFPEFHPCHYSVPARREGFLDGFAGDGVDVQVLGLKVDEIQGWVEEHTSLFDADTVVVASHNLRLYRLVSAFSQLGIRAGKDFGLMTLDDETGLRASFPEISRISFPRVRFGKSAGQMMLDILTGKECLSQEIKGEWLEGKTTDKGMSGQ